MKHDLWLISDEVYDCQIWKGEHISPRSIEEIKDKTLVIGSMSKSHAMTGFRCGWVIGPEDIVKHMVNLATSTTYGVPGFIQEAAYFALLQGTASTARVSEPFFRRYKLATKIFKHSNVLKLVPSSGTMYLMVDVRQTGLSGTMFANLLLETQKIAVMPGESFGESAAGHLRIAMTVSDNEFEKSLIDICSFTNNL